MGRQLLGYRVRGTINGKRFYLDVLEWEWSPNITVPYGNRDECVRANKATCADRGVSDVKIVAVYLKTNEYKSSFASERVREDLSDFGRAVLDEIDRRNVDAIVEPESFKGLPTTLRFRAKNGDFVWLPIVRYAVVDGPEKTRANRTVDRMLQAIDNVHASLSKDEASVAECEGYQCINKITMVGEGPWFCDRCSR